MTGSPLRIAVMGLGWVALHRHIPAILRHPECQLVGVIDRHEGLAAHWANKLNLPHHAQTDSPAQVPWLEQVDALTLGAPPMAHHALAIEALSQGKHVLTEKPFAMSVEEANSMAAAARQTNKILAVVHNFQFSRAVQNLEKDITQGNIGPLQRISAIQLGNPRRRLPVWYEKLPLGLFYDESPHFFYLLNRLTGGSLSLQKAHAVAGLRGHNTPRLVHLLYQSADDIPVTIDCQFDSAISEWHVMVTGEKAVGIVDIFRDIYIRLPNDGAHNAFSILRTSLCAFTQHFLQHIPNGLALARGRLDYGNDEIIRRFVASVRSGHEDEKIGLAQAVHVLKLQHEAVCSLQASLSD